MTKLWTLKRISTEEEIEPPQTLPKNWKTIYGLEGFKEKLNDLSWVGYPDLGWFEVEVEDEPPISKEEIINGQIQHFLNLSLPMVAVDNFEITKAKRYEWILYRQKLKEIPLQPNFPEEVVWPKKPD